jgi:hypothetical protein
MPEVDQLELRQESAGSSTAGRRLAWLWERFATDASSFSTDTGSPTSRRTRPSPRTRSSGSAPSPRPSPPSP